MDEDNKIDEKNSQGDSSAKKKSKEEKAGKLYQLYKKESHKHNKCILPGLEAGVLTDFNKGNVITVSNEQIKIIGCEVNEAGEIVGLPYRWLGVKDE